MKVSILPSQHVFIVGKSGTGKSVFAESYLCYYKNVIKLDTKGEYYERKRKGEPYWYGLQEGKDYTVIFHLADIEEVKTNKIIYVPTFEEQTQEYYNLLLKYVYDRENTIVWIDELMSICDSPRNYPLYLKALMTRGRSKNASVWALSQRPLDIPTIVTSNVTHFVVFNLNLPQDRDKLASVTGMNQLLIKPEGHNFWYYKDDSEKCTLCQINIERR